ncbi:squalene/phytoene synthase family protein [Sphingosinicellaceae bacterium]|nr:squalene/phytoene synthase family protein [Sphingosinicellaceae bacterium]
MDDAVTALVQGADRDRWLATQYAPAGVRAALLAVHALDLELVKVIATTTEPMIGQIRLAWWRERLEGLDRGQVPAQPVLQVLAAEALPRGVMGTELAGFEDAWLALAAGDVARHVEARGLALGAASARLLGGDTVTAVRLATAWAAGEAARNGEPGGVASAPGRVGPNLRPLAGLAALGRRDLGRAANGLPPEPRATPTRQLILLRAALIGR